MISFSTQEIIDWTGGRLVNLSASGSLKSSIQVSRISSLGAAQASDLAFFFSRAFEHELPSARPGILVIGEPFVKPLESSQLPLWKSSQIIACEDPYLAMALLSEKFAAASSEPGATDSTESSTQYKDGKIHSSAVLHPSVKLGECVRIGPHCVLEKGVTIGNGTVLYPGCFIGSECRIGKDCILFPSVTLYEKTELGDRVRLHSGVVLGADGFGYAPRHQKNQVVGHQKIYHFGRVVIGDEVEIGANSCIDRGTFGDTWVERQSKLDNLVQVAHNVRIDEGAIICGGTCVAGNASIGKFAYIGGLSGICNHVHVGDRAKVGAVTLVTKDVPPGETAVGNPQREYQKHFRAHALLSRLLAERRSK